MWIAIAVVVLLAGFLLFVSQKSGTFRWERHITIAAPAGKIFPLIDHFRSWRELKHQSSHVGPVAMLVLPVFLMELCIVRTEEVSSVYNSRPYIGVIQE